VHGVVFRAPTVVMHNLCIRNTSAGGGITLRLFLKRQPALSALLLAARAA
jgi:hypothetical protein